MAKGKKKKDFGPFSEKKEPQLTATVPQGTATVPQRCGSFSKQASRRRGKRPQMNFCNGSQQSAAD